MNVLFPILKVGSIKRRNRVNVDIYCRKDGLNNREKNIKIYVHMRFHIKQSINSNSSRPNHKRQNTTLTFNLKTEISTCKLFSWCSNQILAINLII